MIEPQCRRSQNALQIGAGEALIDLDVRTDRRCRSNRVAPEPLAEFIKPDKPADSG
jgi:hypothetical protein